MLPISCVNCCHNPLQFGPTGTSFGFCARHRVVLQSPELLTCGHLRRKDLYGDSADREASIHSRMFIKSRPVLLHSPKDRTAAERCFESANREVPDDRVVEEVLGWGRITKIATIAALNQIPGARAEIALSSLGRVFVENCVRRGGKSKWKSGIHIVWWTLRRLDGEPAIQATDLRTTFGQRIERVTAIARWLVIGQRLALLADVARHAGAEEDPLGTLASLPDEAALHGDPDQPEKTLRFLRSPSMRSRVKEALSRKRYESIREELGANRRA